MRPQPIHSIASFVVAVSCALILSASFVWAQDVAKPGAAGAAQAGTEDPEWFKGAERPGPGLTNPTLIKSAKPIYTREATEAGVSGEVWLDARVEVDGKVRNVRVVRSTVPMLDAQAEKAAKEFEFRPGMKDGQAVPVIVRIQIAFNLRPKP